jgi:hypothetical protein
MHEIVVRALREQRARIRARWEDLLRIQRTTSPLANPDTLVHLLDLTLDELLASIEAAESRRRAPRHHAEIVCPCGRNPLLFYFSAGRQAVREALVLAQAASPGLSPASRDAALAILDAAYGEIARREIEAFCGVCQLRETAGAQSAVTAAI